MIIPQPHGRLPPSVLLSVVRQDCYAKPAWTQPSSPDSCTKSAAEPFCLEQAMIPQQAMSNDPLSPHTPSPLPTDADATVTGTDMVYLADLPPQPVEWLWQQRLVAGALAMISGESGSGKPWVALATLRRAKFDIGVRSSKDDKSGAWCWTLPPRRIGTRRPTRQDAQINYLSTLSIFMKQTTYLATLPNPNLKANECHCL
jgi:hypothetical protein